MKNLERLQSIADANTFLSELDKMMSFPFYKHMDKEAYLESEDEDMTHFLKTEGMCKVVPSEAELMNNLYNPGGNPTEAERTLYIQTHTKTMPVLQKGLQRFGEPYVMVANFESNTVMTVPEANVIFLDDGEAV